MCYEVTTMIVSVDGLYVEEMVTLTVSRYRPGVTMSVGPATICVTMFPEMLGELASWTGVP